MKPSTRVSDALRELSVGARQWGRRDGIPFGAALLNVTVGEDGRGPI